MKRMLPTLVGVSALASLTPIGRAQQVPFPWSDEVRLTDHPDSSFSDWPASVPMGHARTRDCLHVIWRDFMLRTADCDPARWDCWHFVHQIGWDANDWGVVGAAPPTTRGICVISGPNAHVWDNAGNIVVDGAGRAHFAWESAEQSTLRVRYRWRDAIPQTGDCRSSQLTASEENDSTCTQHGWPEGREAVLSDPNVSSANPTLLLSRPDFSTSPSDSELVHLFYHDSRALHRWRSAGNPSNQWSLGQSWWPLAAASVVVEAPSGDRIGSVSAARDPTNGGLYVAYTQVWDAPHPVADTVRVLGMATAAGPGQAWSTEPIGPSDGWRGEAAPVVAVGRDGRAYVVWAECQQCDEEESKISRVMFRAKSAGAPWGDAIAVCSESLTWVPGVTPFATRPHLVTRDHLEGSQAHLVWTRGKDANREIIHRYLRDGGDPSLLNDWSASAAIADSPIGVSGAKLHSEGTVLFVTWQDHRWREDPTPTNTEMYHRWGPDPEGTGIAERPAGGPPGFRGFSPNPFRGETVALLTLGGNTDPVRIVVTLYDVGGRRVREMATDAAGGRAYMLYWDGRAQSGSLVAPGVYFARVRVDSDVVHQSKLVYVR